MGRAARFLGPHKLLQIQEVENDGPGPEEVLLRVRAAGVCRSDIRVIEGIGYPVKPPLTIGHEIAGEVVETGSKVQSYRLGDRVVVFFGGSCNRCRYCLEGRGSHCPYAAERPMYGLSADGGFAEYCKVDAVNLVRLPESVSWEFGATLGCAGVTAYHAVTKVGKVGLGDYVGVYGVGGVGLYAVQFAKLSGAKVIAIGRNPKKLDMAMRLGADHVVDASKTKGVAEEVRALSGDAGVDVMLDMVSSEETATNSFGSRAKSGSIANGGKLVFVGIPEKLTFDGPPFVRGEFWVTGSRYGTKGELEKVVELAGLGRLGSAVTRMYGLDQINEAISSVRNGEIVGRAAISMK